MKALRAARILVSSPLFTSSIPDLVRPISRNYAVGYPGKASASEDDASPDFDSREFSLPLSSDSTGVAHSFSTAKKEKNHKTWDEKYRAKADRHLFGLAKPLPSQDEDEAEEEEEEDKKRAKILAKALLNAALLHPDDFHEDNMAVKETDQKSLSVGIVGAPNAGKSSLINYIVGTKVAAVSRKTNTTTHEILGVFTKGNTQICFFDTPGLRIGHHGYPYKTDIRDRIESAWSSIDLYDLLIVIFDVYRHITTEPPDTRVINLIRNLGAEAHPKQKRVLVMNKVDLIKEKKMLLNVAKEFEDLPGYERYFMISGQKGSGVKDLVQHLMDRTVKRPWDEEPGKMTEEIMKSISLEVVREKLLHHIHQEIPYVVEHRLMDWKEDRDGSLRVEQHFITQKPSQRNILVGKNGSKIGRIGIEANEELRSIFKKEVHLILLVRVARKRST